jgi:hypothetical protein
VQYALVAAALGVCAGYATGGRLSNVGGRPVRRWPLLVAGAVLPLLAETSLADSVSLACVLGGLGCLLAFCVVNLHLTGMGVVAVGLGLNALVMTVNGAMPVRPAALVTAGVVDDAAEARTLDLGARRRLERPGDHLTVLGDTLPVRVLRQAVSFGDLVIAAGTADVVAHLMHRRRRRRTLVLTP